MQQRPSVTYKPSSIVLSSGSVYQPVDRALIVTCIILPTSPIPAPLQKQVPVQQRYVIYVGFASVVPLPSRVANVIPATKFGTRPPAAFSGWPGACRGSGLRSQSQQAPFPLPDGLQGCRVSGYRISRPTPPPPSHTLRAPPPGLQARRASSLQPMAATCCCSSIWRSTRRCWRGPAWACA